MRATRYLMDRWGITMTLRELTTYHALVEVDNMLGTNKANEYLKSIGEK